jgi:hypothetical protein
MDFSISFLLLKGEREVEPQGFGKHPTIDLISFYSLRLMP